jgi:putative transposase
VINIGTHRIGVGTTWRGHTLTAIRDGDHITVYRPNGLPFGHAHLKPTTTYTPHQDHPRVTHVPGHTLDTSPGA